MSAPQRRAETHGCIGPNAATRLAEALAETEGSEAAHTVFAAAGLAAWLDHPPEAMIREDDAARLFDLTRARYAPERADAVLADAGRRTGRYILANRIPPLARGVLRLLPATLALPLLLKAVSAHAWTFAGSGRVGVEGRVLRIARNPLARPRGALAPACVWHVAVFETLIRALVAPQATVRETACCATGADACVFEIALQPGP